MTEEEDVSQHPWILEGLSRDHPNSIRILPSSHPIDCYTCLMHVFDFTEKPEYTDIASFGLGLIYAGPDFVHWLLERGFLSEVLMPEAKEGNIILYFDSTQFKHAGLLSRANRVVSKWGHKGHLYEHELFEVPECYGSEVRFFIGLNYEDTLCYFHQFAEEKMI